MNGPAPPRMDLVKLSRLGHRRILALKEVEATTADIVEEVAQAGDARNVKLAAKLTGVSRPTLYARLKSKGPAA